MKSFLPLFFVWSSVAFGATDQIQIFAHKLSQDHGWQNGRTPIIKASKDSNQETLLKECFARYSFDVGGEIPKFEIKEIKGIKIEGALPDIYTAALCETDHGQKIVLSQYRDSGWWIRIYETQNTAEQGAAANP